MDFSPSHGLFPRPFWLFCKVPRGQYFQENELTWTNWLHDYKAQFPFQKTPAGPGPKIHFQYKLFNFTSINAAFTSLSWPFFVYSHGIAWQGHIRKSLLMMATSSAKDGKTKPLKHSVMVEDRRGIWNFSKRKHTHITLFASAILLVQ